MNFLPSLASISIYIGASSQVALFAGSYDPNLESLGPILAVTLLSANIPGVDRYSFNDLPDS